MKIFQLKQMLAVLGCMVCGLMNTQAEVVIIAHPSVTVNAITEEDVTGIFLGKTSVLPGGPQVLPVDQKDDQATRADFYAKVVKKDADQLDAYWARMIFTGKGEPPKKLLNNADVLAMVSANPNMIGYVDASAVTDAVKVLLKVP